MRHEAWSLPPYGAQCLLGNLADLYRTNEVTLQLVKFLPGQTRQRTLQVTMLHGSTQKEVAHGQFPVGKTHAGRNGHGIPLGFKTIITPSKDAQHRHQQALGTLIRHAWSLTQEDLIERLNRLICGWVNYYATVASKQTFAKMHALLFAKLLHWAKRRHPRKPIDWITKKYWRRERGSWTFGVKHGPTLYAHDRKPIPRHIKVRDDKSVYDGDWVYWASRLGRHPELPHEVAQLLKRQAGKCAWCGLYFRADDVKERDHLVPTSDGGDEHPRNRQLLHGHCHDQKTAQDGSYAASGTRDKGH